VITIDLANTIFIVCVAVGGILLLITVLLDDIVGGLLSFLHIGFDLGGVTLMPLLLGFVSMFGVGGLFGTQVFGMTACRSRPTASPRSGTPPSNRCATPPAWWWTS
jgi:hypothetical protein